MNEIKPVTNQKKNGNLSKCKFCDAPLQYRFVDVARPATILETELPDGQGSICLFHTFVCSQCFLVQMEEPSLPIVPEHVFCSPFSSLWLTDLKQYVDNVIERLDVSRDGLVVELVSHEQQYVQTGKESGALHFGSARVHELMSMYGLADVLICKNELAFVHDVNDFLSALKLFLKPQGTISLEFLHLLPIMEEGQFDLPPLDRFNYFSFTTIEKIVGQHRLVIYDLEKCSSKGLVRIYAKHREDFSKRISNRVPLFRGNERNAGMSSLTYYENFKKRANRQGRNFQCSLGELQPLI